jgi:aminoglycoside phosphotransferase (APT) family kinase protein
LKEQRNPDLTVALIRLIAAIAPGSRLARVRRLHGGLASVVHAVDLVEPSGVRRRLVVRRRTPESLASGGGDYSEGWRALGLLRGSAVPVPEPVLHDPEGAIFGAPAMVTTRLPGRPVLTPDDLPLWTRRLAEALAAIHDLPISRAELGRLPAPEEDMTRRLDGPPDPRRLAHPRGPELWSALLRLQSSLPSERQALLHGDYGPVNVVWVRRRLSGVLDWDSAGRGSPCHDVAHCRLDLALLHGVEASALFLRAYEDMRGPHSQLAYHDLARAWQALPDPERWLPGVRALGPTDLTPRAMRERLDAFIAEALRGA